MVEVGMKSRLYTFEDKESMLSALVGRMTENIESAIKGYGYASLIVSGGSTPKALFQKLSSVSLPWEKVTISLVDERWVDVSSDESNEYLVQKFLLRNRAQRARFIGLKTGHAHAKDGVAECEKRLDALTLPHTVVVLGMGNDGHTASFFPHMPELQKALDMKSGVRCIAARSTKPPCERVTLTLPFLLNTRNLILHIEGEEKLCLFRRAQKEGSVYDMPIRAVMRQNRVPLEVYHA